MEQNKTHFFCQATLNGEECTDQMCTKQHIKSASINLSEILRINDYFDKSQTFGDEAREITKTRHFIDPTTLPNQPILCNICYQIIDPENSLHFTCCDIYCCKKCFQNWKWESCPKCGKHGTFEELNEEEQAKVKEANNSFHIFEFRPQINQIALSLLKSQQQENEE